MRVLSYVSSSTVSLFSDFLRNKANSKTLVALLMGFLASASFADFVHPGVLHSKESLAFTKEKIAAEEEPWNSLWRSLRKSVYADRDWRAEPRTHVERGPYNQPNIGSSEFTRDSKAAYTFALISVLTDEGETASKRYAGKAAGIIDAWADELESISNHDAALLVGMNGQAYIAAAEILKYTESGWPEVRQKRFERMIREIWLPIIHDFYPTANGNWDAAMLQTMIAMGVFLDDEKLFERATNYFLEGKGNGAVRNYFKPSGVCQESGRDQNHAQMGLEFLANTCETAWIQGVDLYGAFDNRLLKGFEYMAKYNLGFEVPYEPYRSFEGRYFYEALSDKGRGRLRPTYEKVYNHYVNRKGMDADKDVSFSRQVALLSRLHSKGGSRSSAPWDSLMFANHPQSFAQTPQENAQEEKEPKPE